MNLSAAFSRALASIDLRARVRSALLRVARAEESNPNAVGALPRRVLAIGKASGQMVDGAVEAWGDRLTGGIVVLPDESPLPREAARFQILRASHPLPDARSVFAGEAVLAASTGPALALISGGCSSLVFLPVAPSSLAQARARFAALLVSGANVREINAVRRHTSRAHGGALATPGTLTLLASDVIDGSPHDIGSGPTVADPTTCEDAERILARFAPGQTDVALLETSKPAEGDPRFARPPLVVVEPGDLADALADELHAEGFSVRTLAPSTADVAILAGEYLALAKALGPGEAVVRSAEPAVTLGLSSSAEGGRCTHLASLVARELPSGVAFLAAASDGVDGASGTAGALVSHGSFPDRAELDAALAAFATGPLQLARGTALPRGPTGLNLADAHALLRSRERA